jgi:hypothetical protein
MIKKPRSPIEIMMDSVMKCVKCAAKMGACDCWSKCECGWTYEKGKSCRNPAHREEQESLEKERGDAEATGL